MMKKYASILNDSRKLFIAIFIFLLIAVCYCYPILSGKQLHQGDVTSWIGMSHEAKIFSDSTGTSTGWTNSMFGGMPTIQIANSLAVDSIKSPIASATSLFLPLSARIIFTYLLCFFILFRAFKLNTFLSIIAAIATAGSSYFFIIIEAGHVTKCLAIAYCALIIAGTELSFHEKKSRVILGGVLNSIGLGFSIPYHPQMVYYFMLFWGIFLVCKFVRYYQNKNIKSFLTSFLFVALGLIMGIGMNTEYFFANGRYLKETMRGGHSELTTNTQNVQPQNGLNIDYATQWSYGIDETLSLFIPNIKGGSSNTDVGKGSALYDALRSNGVSPSEAIKYCKNVPTYWGTQPFTSGPVYVGAIVLFLFFFGLFQIKGPLKWGLVIVTICSILLSWGKNFMPLTELFMNYFPYYNKFRTVSSILVVAEISIPLLAFLGLHELLKPSNDNNQTSLKHLKYTFYVSVGICFGVFLLSQVYDYTSPNDSQVFSKMPNWYVSAVISDRSSMLKWDLFRSFLFSIITFGALYAYLKGKMKINYLYLSLGLLICIDLGVVNKRYLNADNFVTANQSNQSFKPSSADLAILKDNDPNFRVLNTTTNTYNESMTSYFHKSIGGYSPVKLRRYQDLIERQLAKGNIRVLNMLNTKYVIVRDSKTQQPVAQRNPGAFGNAWFIDSLIYTNTPVEEMNALDSIDPSRVAVADIQFKETIKNYVPKGDDSKIQLLSYAPNEISYQSNTSKDNEVAVFSEIYYPYGWKAYIDEVETPIFRTNYLLRAIKVPSGKHLIRFTYKDELAARWGVVSMVFLFIILLIVLFAIWSEFKIKNTDEERV